MTNAERLIALLEEDEREWTYEELVSRLNLPYQSLVQVASKLYYAGKINRQNRSGTGRTVLSAKVEPVAEPLTYDWLMMFLLNLDEVRVHGGERG